MRLGDDGELIDADEKAKRKQKRKPLEVSVWMVVGLTALLVLIGCLLILNLVNNRLRPVVVLPTATFTPTSTRTPTSTPTLSPTPTITPTYTPTLVITPPTVGIGERPSCAEQRVTGEQRIVFSTVYGEDNRELYILDMSSGVICRLTDSPLIDIDPVWHPNGTTILFSRDESGGEGVRDREFWTINSDGSGLTRIGMLTGAEAQWDVSGDWVVFVGTASGNVEVADRQGDNHRLVSDAPPDQWDEFEPDCCALSILAQPLVVFAAAARPGERTGTSSADAREIYTINADGTGRSRLTTNDVYDDEPNWSPGGNQIVYTRGRYGFNTDIWIMNANGTNPIQLTDGEATDHSPRWLPDGRIMFVSERERAGAIYVMNADGSNVQAITGALGVLSFDFWSSP